MVVENSVICEIKILEMIPREVEIQLVSKRSDSTSSFRLGRRNPGARPRTYRQKVWWHQGTPGSRWR